MEDKKSILIISAVFPPEPVISAKLSHDLATALGNQNRRVIVLSPKASRPLGFNFNYSNKINPFEHIIVDSYVCPRLSFLGRLRETLSFGIACVRYISRNHRFIEIVYSNTWPIFAQFLNVAASKKYKIPIIIHIQDVYPESLLTKTTFLSSFVQSSLKLFDNFSVRNAFGVIAISENMRNYIANSRNIDKSKILVVENWYEPSESLEEYEQPLSVKLGFTFMYLGNIGPLANLESIITAFHKANILNNKLIIAGDGSVKESLIEYVKQLGNKNIEFSNVPEGEVEVFQQKADVLVLPMRKGSLNTSIPSKLPAYMFSARPVLACVDYYSDIAKCVVDAECGWIIEPEEVDLLSESFKKISQYSFEELSVIGKKGLIYANGRFSKKQNLDKILNKFFK